MDIIKAILPIHVILSGFLSFCLLPSLAPADAGYGTAIAQPEHHGTQDHGNHNPKNIDQGRSSHHHGVANDSQGAKSIHDHSDHSAHGQGFLSLNALDLAGFVSFFSFSFFVSLHCALMCAPLVCSVLGPNSHFRRKELWLYNLGRGLAYLSMGSVLGFIGEVLGSWSRMLGLALSWGIGLILIYSAFSYLFPNLLRQGWGSLSFSLRALPQKLLATLRAKDLVKGSLYLGLITVFLPCMTLTPALGAAAASGSAGGGFITMLAFFLGTLPVMIVGPGLSGSMLAKLPQGGGRKVGAIFLLLAAGITIWRGYH